MRLRICPISRVLILASCLPLSLFAGPRNARHVASALAFMDVRVDAPPKFSRLNLGDKLQGKLTQDLFSGYRLMAPCGSRIDLTVSGMKRGSKEHDSLWPWPIRYLRPKYKKLPTFDFADISLPNGKKMRLPVFLVSGIDQVRVTSQPTARIKRSGRSETPSGEPKRANLGSHRLDPSLELVVDAGRFVPSRSSPEVAAHSTSTQPKLSGIDTLQAGTEAKLALLYSAS
jgi:hypothetical protein